MARGTWDDFRSKYGFGDGDSVEDRDFEARAVLISKLNKLPELKRARIRAVPYNRPGMHNPCLIVFLPILDKTEDTVSAEVYHRLSGGDEALVEKWLSGEIQEVSDQKVEEVLENVVLDDLVQESYDECDRR